MVSAEQIKVSRLLEGAKRLQVPLFQRPYSWERPEWQQLWDDIVRLAHERRRLGANETHFIGPVVLAPAPMNSAALPSFIVVDGQQRLTTITLLLAAIRDHREEEEGIDPDEISNQYLVNQYATADANRLKFQPTRKDLDEYASHIVGNASQTRTDLTGADKFFRKKLQSSAPDDVELESEAQESAAEIQEAILFGAELVLITTQQGDNPHRIFESLNNKGRPLTQADLLRNYLFMRLPTTGEKVHAKYWIDLDSMFTPEQLTLLFWLDLVQSDETIRQSETFVQQQRRFDRLTSEAEVAAEIGRIAALGPLLMRILEPENESDEHVRKRLQRLHEWGTTTVYPILLHLLMLRERRKANDKQIATAMLYLESYFVRRLVIGRTTMNINRVLLRAAQEVPVDSKPDEALKTYLSRGQKYWATDAEVLAAAMTSPVYHHGKAHQKRLILTWIEESLPHKERNLDSVRLTIEHVMPQTLSPVWQAEIEATMSKTDRAAYVHDEVVNTLGNLTLTAYNSELSNRSFAEKKSAWLGDSNLQLNREIAKHKHWGAKEIRTRGRLLATRLNSLWPGPA